MKYRCTGCGQDLTEKQLIGMKAKDIGCPFCGHHVIERVAVTPDKLWLATFETRSYTFKTLGRERSDCIQRLAQAWVQHSMDTGADVNYYTEFVDDVVFERLVMGDVLRDGEKI